VKRRLLFAFFLFISPALRAEPFPIETQDFRLWDSQGQPHTLSYYSDKTAILYLSYPQDCDAQKAIFKWYSRLESRLLVKHIQVFWINSHAEQNRTRVNEEVRGEFFAPVLMDPSQMASRRLAFRQAGNFAVIDPRDWQKTLSGDWTDGTLEKFLEVPWEKSADSPPRCALRLQDRTPIVWNKNLAKKVMNDCIYCHLNYTNAELFNSDEDLFRWASMSLLSIRVGKMPLNGFDIEESQCGNFFSRGKLNPQDIYEIENWLDAGAPHASAKQDYLKGMVAEEKAKIVAQAKALGQPFTIWQTPEEKMPVSGRDYYRFYQVAGPLVDDLWVGAMAVSKGSVTPHHMDLHAIPVPLAEYEKTLPDKDDLSESISLERYAKLVSLPLRLTKFDKSQIFFPKGSYVVAVVHYHPNGNLSTVAPTTMKVYAATGKKSERKLSGLTLRKGDTEILPQERNHHVIRKRVFPMDIELEGIAVHTHSRGKLIDISALPPSGQKTLLCRSNEFQLDSISSFSKPIFIPKNTVLLMDFVYDNSSQNPINPDFNKTIQVGPYLSDEMGNIRFIYHEKADPRPETGSER
jgi:hypothetical protein